MNHDPKRNAEGDTGAASDPSPGLVCFGCGKPIHSITFKVIRGATAHPVCQACWEKDLTAPAATPSAESKRTVIYTRVSPGSDLSALTAQEQLCQSVIDAKGWTHIRTLSDVAAGSATERPQYQALLRLVEARQCDAVVIARPDRLERFPHAYGALLMYFSKYEVELVSVMGEGRG